MSSSVSTEIHSLWLEEARKKDPNLPSRTPATGVTDEMKAEAISIAEDRPVRNATTVTGLTPVVQDVSNAIYTELVTKMLPFCLLYTSPSPRDGLLSRMPSSA